MNELEILEKAVQEFDEKHKGKPWEIEDHPTYKLYEHTDGYEQECFCRMCGSYR